MPAPSDLGVDLGAAGLGVLLGLEDQDAGALTEHEAVAAGVPRAGDRGRVAVAFLDSAIMLANAAIGSGWIAASVPPATTTSARPSRIRSSPGRCASLPDAQAETGVLHRGPGADVQADVARPGAFGISIGTASGETRRGPFSLSAS